MAETTIPENLRYTEDHEWVDVEDYIRAIKICAKIIVDWSR